MAVTAARSLIEAGGNSADGMSGTGTLFPLWSPFLWNPFPIETVRYTVIDRPSRPPETTAAPPSVVIVPDAPSAPPPAPPPPTAFYPAPAPIVGIAPVPSVPDAPASPVPGASVRGAGPTFAWWMVAGAKPQPRRAPRRRAPRRRRASPPQRRTRPTRPTRRPVTTPDTAPRRTTPPRWLPRRLPTMNPVGFLLDVLDAYLHPKLPAPTKRRPPPESSQPATRSIPRTGDLVEDVRAQVRERVREQPRAVPSPRPTASAEQLPSAGREAWTLEDPVDLGDPFSVAPPSPSRGIGTGVQPAPSTERAFPFPSSVPSSVPRRRARPAPRVQPSAPGMPSIPASPFLPLQPVPGLQPFSPLQPVVPSSSPSPSPLTALQPRPVGSIETTPQEQADRCAEAAREKRARRKRDCKVVGYKTVTFRRAICQSSNERRS